MTRKNMLREQMRREKMRNMSYHVLHL